ncbi:Mfa1 family fimbria major subunit [Parabacteroides sp. PF5-9]|uniref:Mfa1 family fimbria major subunit n=1 Tax=Parabacteroides sp. PF5-9 TaxID=1742404 RepID=UPI002475FFA1|nr:Mfa1 family fimbria major subunit [Parabacteroides sp. PF5-9]
MATLTVGLIFTSCSDDSDDIVDKGKTEGEIGYVSLALINSSVRGMTKAEGSLHYGTADENNVDSALIVLYDGATPASSKVKYHIKLTEIGTPGAPGGDMHSISPGSSATTYRTKAQEVVKANYKLAVFINPPAALDAVTALDQTLGAMTAAASVTVDQLTMGKTKRDNFLMSNFAGLVDVLESDIYDTEAEAEVAPVKLNVERAVAKVTLGVASNLATASASLGATIGEIKWDVDVINKKTFWMRNPAEMLDAPSGTVVGTTTEVATAANRIYMYAKDPNWDDFSHSRNTTLTDPLTDEFIYKTGTATLALAPTTSTDPVNEDTYAYVTENTMAALEQWEDVTTCVLISAVITPKKTFFGETLNAGDQYFLFRNMAFTLRDIQEIHLAYSSDAQTITSASGKTWKVLIAEAANAGIIALPGILEGMKGTEDFNEYTAAPSKSKDVIKSNGTVRFFAEDAPNYYYVPIRHFSDDLQADAMAYGRYGVVRNNWYNLSLNSIKSYGTAEIPTDRPDPDDKEESWLSVEFTILPWIERGQGIGL